MANETLSTRALLACGIAAGPLYVTVTMIEALTRDGFDLRYHRFSWLTTGDLGWIHQSSMVLVGVSAVLLGLGARRIMKTGPGATWGPRVLVLFGLAYVAGGLLRADPVVGFPPEASGRALGPSAGATATATEAAARRTALSRC